VTVGRQALARVDVDGSVLHVEKPKDSFVSRRVGVTYPRAILLLFFSI
jgi:hypothetical protein